MDKLFSSPEDKIKKVLIFYRPDMEKAPAWAKKIGKWIKQYHPSVRIISEGAVKKPGNSPDIIFVLGGDGTILEAIQKFYKSNPLIMGLNLGHVGFIAAVRKEKDFIKGLKTVFSGRYKADPRLMMSATIVRNGKAIARLNAINDITIQHLMGLVKLRVEIENYPIQYINGNGILVATATGSTAYNLAAHGPIVMPNIRCFIITELLDYSLPTPSIIIKRDHHITITVQDFRKQNKFAIAGSRKSADVILYSDNYTTVPLEKGDKVIIGESKYPVRFVEIEDNYFFKSLREKFAFK